MSEQPRQPFRFRFPWVTYPTPTPTQPQPQPAQPTITSRPPFRPGGVAPPRPSSQTQAPPRTDPQPPSQARVASLPLSPKVPSQPQVAPKTESRPPSPAREATQTRVISQPSSPPQPILPKPQAVPKTESRPPSPAREATQTRVISQPPSLSPPQPILPKPQAVPKIESRPTSPAREATQTRVISQPLSPPQPILPKPQAARKTESQPPSPARGAPRRVISQPPSPSQSILPIPAKSESPSKRAPQSRVPSQPSSPSRITPWQPQVPPKTDPELPSVSQAAPGSRGPSQPPSPSRTTSQPQPGIRKTSQPTSPALTATKPERISQPPSPIIPAFQLPTKTPSKAPSPPRMSSLEESAAQTASKLLPIPTDAPQSKSTPQAPPKVSSPSRTPGSQTEPISDKILQSQTTIPKPKEAEGDKPREINEEKTMIPPSEEPKQKSIPELQQMAPGSHLRPKAKLGAISEEEKQPVMQQAVRDKKEMLPTTATGEQRKTVIPIHQKERRESSDHYPKSSLPQGEQPPIHKEIRDDITKLMQKLSTEYPKQFPNDNPVSVITLAGENRGATMHLDANAEKQEGVIHIRRGYKLNKDAGSDATTDGETSSKKRSSDPVIREDPSSTVYINSNTQSVNNSIVFDTPISEGSPGVHFVLSHKPKEPVESNEKTESVQARKSDFNVTQSQKLTYEPTIRRRCLRGLFLESSESDPDNPDKPRRHGCRYSCAEKQKATDNVNEG